MFDVFWGIETLEKERTQALARFIEFDNLWRMYTGTIMDTPEGPAYSPRPGDSLAYASEPPRAVRLVLDDVVPSINREIRLREFDEDLRLWRVLRSWWYLRMRSLVAPLGGKFPFEPLRDPVIVVTFDDQPYRDLDNYNVKHAINALVRTGFIRDDRDVVTYLVRRRKPERPLAPPDPVTTEILIVESQGLVDPAGSLISSQVSRPDLREIASKPKETGPVKNFYAT